MSAQHTDLDNKDLSRRFTALFNNDDLTRIEEVLSPGFVLHGGSAGEIVGLEQMRAFIGAYRTAFPDARSTVEDQIAEGDKVVTRWFARGTHAGGFYGLMPTGKPFAISGITIERVAGGKLAEVWVNRDDLGLLRQLGAVPGPDSSSESQRQQR